MIIKELTAIVDGRRTVYRVGDSYIHDGRCVILEQIYDNDHQVRGVMAVYDPLNGGSSHSCALSRLHPLPPLQVLAEQAE